MLSRACLHVHNAERGNTSLGVCHTARQRGVQAASGVRAVHAVARPLALVAAVVGEAVHAPAAAGVRAEDALVQATILIARAALPAARRRCAYGCSFDQT